MEKDFTLDPFLEAEVQDRGVLEYFGSGLLHPCTSV